MSNYANLHFTGPPGCIEDDLGFKRPWNNSLTDSEEMKRLEKAYTEFWSSYLPVIRRRRKRWEKADPRQHPRTMQRFIHKGIPAVYRRDMWMRNCPPRGISSTVVPSSVADEIRLDLPRTFPDNSRLRDERSRNAVGRILYEVAKFVPSIGYCQGLNFIAGLLWLVLGDEEKTKDLIIHLIRDRKEWYGSDMAGLQRDMRVLHYILMTELPAVHRVLEHLDVGLDILIGKWFLCWYLDSLPLETVLRIWDCFIYDGDVWLFKVALSLLRSNATRIVACSTMDQLLTAFQSITSSKHALYCHQLMKNADGEKVTQEHLDKLREMLK